MVFNDLHRIYILRYFPLCPTVINLNATDICDSHCVMCNIWKREKEYEFSDVELKRILNDKLFKNVEHVGITGGEPTLRNDLPGVYRAVLESLPKLKGVSIITNAIRSQETIDLILEINKICQHYNKIFSVMVSLDGVEEIHDIIRGTPGNFNSAMSVLMYLKNNTTIPVSIGCTISKGNVWYIDELLDFMIEHKIYGRFRIAEFIKRLYNEANKKSIRNFTNEEKYHLQLFFKKLLVKFETNETYKRTYESIINMLGGGVRLIGCPYQREGVVLNSKGELSYCAPKSDIIGNALEVSAYKLYKNNLTHRSEIFKNYCKDCIHDYHYKITNNEIRILLKQKILNRLFDTSKPNRVIWASKLIPAIYNKLTYQIMIVGWYGTETVGDKAILGGIINEYKKRYDNLSVIISSIYPFVTKNTLRELEISALVISHKSMEFIKYSKSSDEIIMGGGPLMNIDEIYIPFNAFTIASAHNKKTIIYGCGIGPISGRYLEMLKRIINITDKITLRDSGSVRYLRTIFPNIDASVTKDPSIKFVQETEKKITPVKENILSCFLREWTREYTLFTNEDFILKRQNFEKALAKIIIDKATKLKVDKIRLCHMHNFVIGNDDRDFSRRFIKEYFQGENISIEYDNRLSTVAGIIGQMKASQFNICMRYHSVVFAETLNTDYIAIDYTNGGKIKGFLEDNNKLGRMISINDFIY